jgi:DUF3050 family protein
MSVPMAPLSATLTSTSAPWATSVPKRWHSIVLLPGANRDFYRSCPGADRCVLSHVRAFVAHTMRLLNSATTEEGLAAFVYGREDIIPEMFRRLLRTLYDARHNDDRLRNFIYYVDRHIELDDDTHGLMRQGAAGRAGELAAWNRARIACCM